MLPLNPAEGSIGPNFGVCHVIFKTTTRTYTHMNRRAFIGYVKVCRINF